jgi:hypothetical protein
MPILSGERRAGFLKTDFSKLLACDDEGGNDIVPVCPSLAVMDVVVVIFFLISRI